MKSKRPNPPKNSPEQRAAANLNPSLRPNPSDTRMYEAATYRAARKHRAVANSTHASKQS